MDHKIVAEGFGVRLRPVRMADAAFIVALRNMEHAKGRVGDSATGTAAQEEWLKVYFKREGDYYFIVETAGGFAVGAYGIYAITGKSAESGRWVIQPGVAAAIPSAMLAFDTAFNQLGMTELRVTTVSTNQHVLSLNRRFGFRQVEVEKGAKIIGGQPIDLVHYRMSAEEWTKAREKLLPLAKVAETQVRDWEREQAGTTAS